MKHSGTNNQAVIYDNQSLMALLKKIDGNKESFATSYKDNHIDAIRVDNKCTFIDCMPFDTAQYVFILNGAVVISPIYNSHKKSVSNNVRTREDFFKAFSKLNIKNIVSKDILELFPARETYNYYQEEEAYIDEENYYSGYMGDLGTDEIDFGY